MLYLSNRKQQVKVGKVQSEFMEIKSSFPQWSVFGPLLCLIYINDIANSCPDLNTDLYADFSNLFKSDTQLSKIESHLQSNRDCISKWCTYTNMDLHQQKTKCMIIGSKQKLEMKQMFYNSYLVLIFDYCCTIWGKSNNSHINKQIRGIDIHRRTGFVDRWEVKKFREMCM